MKITHSKLTLSPSDLVNYLGCKHLTEQSRNVALGKRSKPDWNDPALAILHKKGIEHEEAYLNKLVADGFSTKDLTDKGFNDTVAAMQEGYDVIYQARLSNDKWGGIADFLIKKQGESALGDYHYEIEDTKLAQETKAGTILQLSVYAEIVNTIQDKYPGHVHVVKPGEGFPKDSYRVSDFLYYYQLVKKQFEDVIEAGKQITYPVPVEKCNTCQYWKECNDKWHEDDHLSLVAGMRTSNRKVIESEDVQTLEGFARKERPLDKRPNQGALETFVKLHSQARVQLEGRENNSLIYKLLDVEEKRGLNRLPKPTENDVYFDIEGDHFYKDGGIEYLLGVSFKDNNGELIYKGWWCENRKGEKEAFVQLIQFILQQWEENPDLHIYHYGHYEASAIKRLASRHAVMEKEVDDLLRAHKFVDLYSIIKESLQASVEGYPLKDLEKFTDYTREADLREASAARRSYSAALELNAVDKLNKEILPTIETYNKDDCLATEALHRWIEDIFQKAAKDGLSVKRPDVETEEASDQVKGRDEKALALYESLTDNIDAENRNEEEQARWLLAHMVAYYRREERSNAWEFHHLNDMELDELVYERKAISYLTFDKDLSDDKNTIHRYKFPDQEVSLKKGDSLRAILGDNIGAVTDIDQNSVSIKKNNKSSDIHPDAVIENNYIRTTGLENALHDLAEDIINNGFSDDGPYKVAKDMLLSVRPKFENPVDAELRLADEKLVDAGIRLANELVNSYLPIQGPPGTGKSFTGAHIIIDLIQKGKKVGITAVSHSVIRGLIDKILDLSDKNSRGIECVHKTGKKKERDGLTFQGDNTRAINALGDGKVVGGTAFIWARGEATDCMDYLFVDEAGQMSLAYVLAIARSAKNVILLGDPQQLEQPQKGAHPEGADVSALEHILGKRKTILPDKGIFLDTTWRLNPDICAFTSEVYYENRLKPHENTSRQKLTSKSKYSGRGLFYVPMDHEGNRNKSLEEVEKIKAIVGALLSSETTWTDRDGDTHKLEEKDIMVVAPYNAQVDALKGALPQIRVGTVDKFQGKEAPVVIYSMASSSPEEAPRGMSFLYDPNRLNVATSRAQCICILVASDKLTGPECHTIDQMSWANGLCRYVEMRKVI